MKSIALCSVLVFMCGCGAASSSGLKLVKAGGTVTLDGKPLTNATVRFIPQPPPGSPATFKVEESSAVTNADGHYTLQGVHEGAGTGAMPGEHRVVIAKRAMKDGSELPKGEVDYAILWDKIVDVVPSIYSDPEKTTLKATVSPDGGEFNFDLKSKP